MFRAWPVALLLFVAGCPSDYRVQERCAPAEESPQWVAECIRNANPKSDEEPEDMIAQCERTSRRLHCESTSLMVRRRRHNAQWVPCEGAKDPRAAAACREAWYTEDSDAE